MTKNDYLKALKNEIQALPFSEQKEALEYYENYFLDAGIENEQRVIEELGDVRVLAREILSNFACVPQSVEEKKKASSKGKKESSSSNKWLIAILVVITFPIWINIVGALFAFVVSLLAIGFSGIVAALAIFIAAIATIGVALWAFVSSPLVGLFLVGACFILVSIGIFTWIVGFCFFSKFVPWVWTGIKKLYISIRQKIKQTI